MKGTVYYLVAVTAEHGDAELEQDMKEAIIDLLTDYQGSGSEVTVTLGT